MLRRLRHRRRPGAGRAEAGERRCAALARLRHQLAPRGRARDPSQPVNPHRGPFGPAASRSRPGATSAAIRAASMGSVPEPQSGSTALPPAAAIPGHPARARSAAARVSLRGASDLLAGRPVPAPVQAFPRKVYGHDGLAAADVDVDAQVGARHVDRRAASKPRAELVDDHVLGALCAEHRVGHPDGRPEAGKIDRQRAVRREVSGPVDRFQARPEGVGAAIERQLRQAQQNALGEPRPQAGAIAERERSGKRRAAALLDDGRRRHSRGCRPQALRSSSASSASTPLAAVAKNCRSLSRRSGGSWVTLAHA